MSLNQGIVKHIETTIEIYINTIADKFSLDKEELRSLWYGENNKPAPSLHTVDMSDLSVERLMKSSKAELTALCKSKCLKCTGTKDQLISRLLGKEDGDSSAKSSSAKSSSVKSSSAKNTVQTKIDVASTSSANSNSVKTSSAKNTVPEVVKNLSSQVSAIHIRANAFGNLEHPATRFVFHKSTQKVIGKQEDDGSISELTDDDIDQCKRYKFTYTIPNNLDAGNLDAVQIDELSDVDQDADEDVDVEEIEEEEEDEDVE